MRTKLFGPNDYNIDDRVGFARIEAHEIDEIGVAGIIGKTLKVVGSAPVYLSIGNDGQFAVPGSFLIYLTSS